MRGVSPTVGNPNPWAASIDADDCHEGFEDPIYTPHTSLSSLVDLVPLAGQTAPNGNVWKTDSTIYAGIVDNEIAQTGPEWSPEGIGFHQQGVIGGADLAMLLAVRGHTCVGGQWVDP